MTAHNNSGIEAIRPPPHIILLGALAALAPLSIDMGLPALPALEQAFHTHSGPLTLSVFMAGFALTPLFYGGLSDRLGRRPLLILGLLLFTIGGIACAVATSFESLLISRFVQGAGAGAGPTIAFAAARDQYAGIYLARRMVALSIVLTAAPVIAPSIGAAVLLLGGWRAISWTLAIAGFVLLAGAIRFFGETRWIAAGSAAGENLTAKPVAPPDTNTMLRYGTIYGLASGSMFAFISGSPSLMIGDYKTSPVLFSWLFAAIAGGIMLGSILSGVLSGRIAVRGLVHAGLFLMTLGSVLCIALLFAHQATLYRFVSCTVAVMFGFGLIAPATSQAVLDPIPSRAGIFSAFMNSFQMLCMSASSAIVVPALQRLGPAALPDSMLAFAVLAWLLLPRRTA